MKRWSFVALLLLGATILGGTVLREPVAGAASAVLNVSIVGPLDENGNVKVHEQGMVRDADQPALQPFQKDLRAEFAEAATFTCESFDVPAGKRLVVEFASFRGGLSADDQYYTDVWIVSTTSGGTALHFLDFGKISQERLWHASETVRLYADPETQVSLCAQRHLEFSSSATFRGTLSGHLVNIN